MAAMTIRKALRTPTFRLTFTADYMRRMARLEQLVGELGKSEGVAEWSVAEVRAMQLGRIGQSMLVCVGGDRFWLDKPADRNKLAAKRREEARWWLRQDITVSEAMAHPQVTVSESCERSEAPASSVVA